MRPLSLAHLTFLELPPPALIRLAADAGFTAVGLRLIAVTPTTAGYPLMHDAALMRDTLAALRDTGLSVNDIEFLRLTPDFDASTFDALLEAGARLGAKHIVTAPYDPDLGRLTENLAAFADHAAKFGLAPVLEFFPWTNVPDLNSALDIATKTGNPDIGVLLDTLHFDRSGSAVQDILNADPRRMPFFHLCDAPVQPTYTEAALLHTAREARMIPSQGQIALAEIISCLPKAIPAALEIPMQSDLSNAELARKMVQATHSLLNSDA